MMKMETSTLRNRIKKFAMLCFGKNLHQNLKTLPDGRVSFDVSRYLPCHLDARLQEICVDSRKLYR